MIIEVKNGKLILRNNHYLEDLKKQPQYNMCKHFASAVFIKDKLSQL